MRLLHITILLFFLNNYSQERKIASAFKFEKAPIGKETLADTGKEVAQFLDLENPDHYTGHCFR